MGRNQTRRFRCRGRRRISPLLARARHDPRLLLRLSRAASIDLEHDAADIDKKVACPTLAFWGGDGVMHKLFDIGAAWRKRCQYVAMESLPGGHFFIDQFPAETAQIVAKFLKG